MIDSVQIRRHGAVDFHSHYESLCAIQDSVPVPAIRTSYGHRTLCFNADRVKVSDWPPILNSLKINKNLKSISIKSCHQPGLSDSGAEKLGIYFKRRVPPIHSKDMTFQLCASIAGCLSVSNSLSSLELHGLPLRKRDLKILAKGLAASKSLESVSLPHCSCGDEGLEIICQSIKNSETIKIVDFTGCSLTWRGAEYIANVIKHQATRRHSETWAESLRYRRPDLDCMTGLRRVTLNCNTFVGDRGANSLAEILAEDLWLKALDMRQCGISNEGAESFLKALQTNTTLLVLDMRQNPLIDYSLLKTLTERVLMNAHGSNSEYKWFKSPSSKDGSKVRQKCRSTNVRHGWKGRNTLRIGISTKKHLISTTTLKELYDPEPKPPGVKGFLPWRTAERANRRREKSPDWSPSSPSQTGTGVHILVNSDTSESEEADSSLDVSDLAAVESLRKSDTKKLKRLQVELNDCQLRLHEERKTRLKADERITELEMENNRLRQINQSLFDALQTRTISSSLLEDEDVLESIEKSFKKFHAFLDLLRDAGLGQLASVAGIDQSDFLLPGDPQMSTTAGISHHPHTEINQNLHRTFVIGQPHNSGEKGNPIGLTESCSAAPLPVPVKPDKLCNANQKSKAGTSFDVALKDREGYKNRGETSIQQYTKDADSVKNGSMHDYKGPSSNECSSTDSSKSKKSNTSRKSKASPGGMDSNSSKRGLSAKTNESDLKASGDRHQNGTKTPLLSNASMSGSEIQEDMNSVEFQSSGSHEIIQGE
ncbi:centrosomal of 78 kDa [Pelobates cultripes]|uniref:Centrosomal protein of 78 kDa n=3 Tax=Pelobates cultripes TaxID=61616 RepID=A0AAD1SA33_PELCU|nr:centrosomal of 78 kDa [Pelobates cultripes]